MAKRLTEAQRRILSRLAGGDEIWTVIGRNPSAFWHSSLTDRAPSLVSIHALWKRGFVEDYGREFGGGKYRITEAGRQALAQEDSRERD